MNTRLPIFQMTFGATNNKQFGLVFSSELNEYDTQSLLFVVPLLRELHHFLDIVHYFKEYRPYFPFQINDKYLELEASIDFPELIFEVPETDFSITFAINFYDFFPFYDRFSYVGEFKNIVPINYGFIPLTPIDLYEMDELYNEHKGIFVGLTPSFGETKSLG